MTHTELFAARLPQAINLIRACETDLNRQLSHGERCDLLKDNTDWSNWWVSYIIAILGQIQGRV